VFVANAGDSRCVMGSPTGDMVQRITTDHKPDEEKEKSRIESLGGSVQLKVENGHKVARVNGILGVARAMGDFDLEDVLTCEPDVFSN